jgi:hypothetical protein
MTEPVAQESKGWSLGPVLITVGALTLFLAQDVPQTSLGNNQDPGPRAFPVALAVLLILGGIYELGRFLLRRARPGAPTTAATGLRRLWKPLARPENRDALILIGALAFYLTVMPWVGFPLATLAFSAGMMLRLGAPWKLATPVSVGLVVAIYLLFTVLFKVQLPPGVLGLSW